MLLTTAVAGTAARADEGDALRRHVGVGVSAPGGVFVDVQARHLYAFANAPVIGASIGFFVGSAGAGPSWRLSRDGRWRLDAFAFAAGGVFGDHEDRLLALGVGAGVHYTSPRGFTFGARLPVLGFGVLADHLDAAFLQGYVLAAAALPTLAFGYRF